MRFVAIHFELKKKKKKSNKVAKLVKLPSYLVIPFVNKNKNGHVSLSYWQTVFLSGSEETL